MEPVLKIENLGKKYILQHQSKERYLALRDVITDKAKSALQMRKKKAHNYAEEFWALKDVSFEVKQGDRLGIIGKNGAGKSTLLKIISQITEPTEGRITINGRVASLLEVGTGFHPELTGRENIFLNGSILGMSKKEIQSKFDEIVAFSEVERFLDTPVKRYSSGMYVRLAFSVAVHLEPDILIIDEVLAVGDFTFQKKCIKKIQEVSGHGRTVLFVSHNMFAIQKVCTTGVLLKAGQMVASGHIENVVTKYIETSDAAQSVYEFPLTADSKDKPGHPTRMQVEDSNGNLVTEIPVGRIWQIRVLFTLKEEVEHFIIAIGLKNMDEIPIRTFYSKPADIKAGNYEAIFRSDNIMLAAEAYSLVLGLSSHENSFFYMEGAGKIHISELTEVADERIVRVSSVGLILNPIEVVINKL